jgi:hypothetical protein
MLMEIESFFYLFPTDKLCLRFEIVQQPLMINNYTINYYYAYYSNNWQHFKSCITSFPISKHQFHIIFQKQYNFCY